MGDKDGGPFTTNRNKDQDTKQDIGPTEEIPIYNIFNQGNQHVKFTLKQRRYIDLDFSNLSNEFTGYVIPYNTVGFWISNANDAHNQNFQNYMALAAISWGMVWLQGRYTINLQSVTRQRLLQTGETNTLTWDFETSQNLVHATLDRTPTYYEVSTQGTIAARLAQYKIGGITHEEPGFWSSDTDPCTYEQIAQRQRLHKHINFAPPPKGFAYQLPSANTTTMEALIPGRDRVSQMGSNTFLMGNNSNVVTETLTNGSGNNILTVTESTFDNTKATPMHVLLQPKIPDETGYMKFRYQLHYETELDIILLMKPDFRAVNTSENTLNTHMFVAHEQRFILPYATLPTNVQNARVPCFPYNLTNN